jgi:hypothetical protein
LASYNFRVRRLVFSSIAFLGFALGLHASVPATSRAPQLDRPISIQFENGVASAQNRPALELTASPADVSFYEEFYPSGTVRQEPQQPKAGVLHWIASVFKKAVRR